MILDDPGNVTVIFTENRQSLTICDWKNEIFYIGGNFYKRVPEGMDGPCRSTRYSIKSRGAANKLNHKEKNMKMLQATQESHDVRVYDGGCVYFLDFPEGVNEMSPQEVANDFLEKYDGEQEVDFSVTFACDDSEYNFNGIPGKKATDA